MADANDIVSAIAQNLAQPKRARTDAGEVEQHDLGDQIAAAKFVLSVSPSVAQAAVSPFASLRRARIEMPGACG